MSIQRHPGASDHLVYKNPFSTIKLLALFQMFISRVEGEKINNANLGGKKAVVKC